MKAIKKIAAAASRLWGRLLKKRGFSALCSEGRRAAYRRLVILGSILCFIALIILIPIFSADSAQVELLALKKSTDLMGPCHEACRQERLLRREKIAASLLEDERLLAEVADYFQIESFKHETASLDFYQELLAIINLAYGSKEPPAFLIDYLAAPEGREEIKALLIRLVLSRIVEPDLVDYYFMILEGKSGRVLKEEAVRSLNMLPASSDFLSAEQIERLVNLILSEELTAALKPSLIFLLTRYYDNFSEIVIYSTAKIYTESPEPVIKLLAADLMKDWGQTGYVYPEVATDEWDKYFK